MVESWRVHQRHRPGTQEASRLRSRDAQSNRRDRCAPATQEARCASTSGQQRGQIKDAVSIRERPPEVEESALPRHWEGDLLAGSPNTHVATLVECTSRFS